MYFQADPVLTRLFRSGETEAKSSIASGIKREFKFW